MLGVGLGKKPVRKGRGNMYLGESFVLLDRTWVWLVPGQPGWA